MLIFLFTPTKKVERKLYKQPSHDGRESDSERERWGWLRETDRKIERVIQKDWGIERERESGWV